MFSATASFCFGGASVASVYLSSVKYQLACHRGVIARVHWIRPWENWSSPKAKIACVLLPGLQGLPCVWSFCFLLSPAVPNYGVQGWGYCLFPTCNASSMCFFIPFWCSTTSFSISNVLSFLKTWFILHHPDSSYSWSHTGNFQPVITPWSDHRHYFLLQSNECILTSLCGFNLHLPDG